MAPEMEAAEAADSPSALRQGTEMLETFLSLMPDAAVAVDVGGTIIAVNNRTEASFGHSARELVGKKIEILVPERFRHTHRRQRSEYSNDPHARPMGAGLDLYGRRRDGSEFPVDISLAPIGGDKDPLVVAAIRDMTDRKASQSAQAQLAAIVQSSAEGIFSLTRGGVITSWNPAAQAMFGYDRGDVIGHHLSQFFGADPVLEELLEVAGAGRSSPPRDTTWLTHDGTAIDVAVSVSHLELSDDGYSVLVRDIRVRKAAEAQLRRQERVQAAAAEIRLSLLADRSLEVSLDLVCKWAVELSGAVAAVLVVVDDVRPRLVATAGDTAAVTAVRGELGAVAVLVSGVPVRLGNRMEARGLPISFPGRDEARAGALVIVGRDSMKLEGDHEEVLTSLADQAILAFELANVRSERDRLLISADRERIARDLHDLVIQRLFGAGLRLQGALGLIGNQAAAARVSSTIDDLDTTIKEIRESIFALESAPGTGLRAKVLETVADATEALGFKPDVSFHGLADREVDPQVEAEAVAVLREALSNAARHAHGSRVDVRITVDDELGVLVVDNGVGIGHPERLSGIANAGARAEILGGRLELSAAAGGGTCFEWRVPLSTGTSHS